MTPAQYPVSALIHDSPELPPENLMQHTASGAGTGVASLEGLLVVSLAEIVGAAVHDDGALQKTVLHQPPITNLE